MKNLKRYIRAVLYAKGQTFRQISKAMGHRADWLTSVIYYRIRSNTVFGPVFLAKLAEQLEIPVDYLSQAMNGYYIRPQKWLEYEYKHVKDRHDLADFIEKLCYFQGLTSTSLSRKFEHNPNYINDSIHSKSKRHIAKVLKQIAPLLDISERTLIKLLKATPDHYRQRYSRHLTFGQRKLLDFLKSYLLLRHISLNKAGHALGHSKEWIIQRLFSSRQIPLEQKETLLKALSKLLDIHYADFKQILREDYTPLKKLQQSMTEKVHDRRSLLDLFMVASLLRGHTLNEVSAKFGHRGKYIGHAIKTRSFQTLIKRLSPVADYLSIPNIKGLLNQSNIFVAKTNSLYGRGVYTGLSNQDRSHIRSAVLKIAHQHLVAFRDIDKSLPYYSISSEIARGSRQGVVKTLAWLSYKLDEAPSKFIGIMSDNGLSDFNSVFMNNLKRYQKNKLK